MGSPPPAPTDLKLVSLGANAALAATGGCLDAFTYVGHGHVFANAMTGNVVLLAANAFGRDWHQSFRHLPPILTFLLGIACVRALGLPRFGPEQYRQARIVLTVEILCLLLLSWLPASTPDFPIVTVICFAASLQTATFRQVNNAAYNSTFATGNLRTLMESFFDWVFKGRKPADLQKARDFATICSAFFFGALVGGLVTPRLHNKTLLLVVASLMAVLFQVSASEASSIARRRRRPRNRPGPQQQLLLLRPLTRRRILVSIREVGGNPETVAPIHHQVERQISRAVTFPSRPCGNTSYLGIAAPIRS